MKVLVATDLRPLHIYLQESLTDLDGIKLAEVRLDADDARKYALRWLPDVLLMDIGMRGGRGAYILEMIKKFRPPTVIIVATLVASEDLRKAMLELGADFVFDKSSEQKQIPAILRDLKLKNRLADQSGASNENHYAS